MKRLKPIDEYCRVRLGVREGRDGSGLRPCLPLKEDVCTKPTCGLVFPGWVWEVWRDCHLGGITPEAGPLSGAVRAKALPLSKDIHVYKILGQTPSTSLGVKCQRDRRVVFAGGRRIISLHFF